MLYRFRFFYLFLPFFLANLSAQNQDIEKIVSRIQAHFAIQDNLSAGWEAEQGILRYPSSEALWAVYIRALAREGDEKGMLKAWRQYAEFFPEQALNRDLIEEMAWGVLTKASNSSSLTMRQMALLAALFSEDSKGVNILYRGMQDSNYAIRSVAVTLSGQLRDTKLIRQMKYLFKEEKNWAVRQKVIEAIGSMHILEMRKDLEAIIASEYSLAEEKALATKSLVKLLDHIDAGEIAGLAASNRAGLRLLACKAIAHFQSLRDLDQLTSLANDYHADVRLAAIQAIGQLKPMIRNQVILNLARKGCQDSNYKVSIASAWLLTLYQPEEGMQQLERHIYNGKRDQRLFAASALRATGHYGAPLSLKLFDKHPDFYVRLNLALGLVGQRLAISGVCRVLEESLKSEEKWCEKETGLFHLIIGRHIYHESDSDETPEMEDQLLRLEILNKLALLKSPSAQEAARCFLANRSWGITGTAVGLLLTEGDESSIALVESLLTDEQPKVRLQAALVLSLWSHEETPLKVLEQSFRDGDKEQKSRILEGLGRIGSMKSVPFLIQVMSDPSQTLRLIAAMALIQCLNH
jgi:HEAT repeat protein